MKNNEKLDNLSKKEDLKDEKKLEKELDKKRKVNKFLLIVIIILLLLLLVAPITCAEMVRNSKSEAVTPETCKQFFKENTDTEEKNDVNTDNSISSLISTLYKLDRKDVIREILADLDFSQSDIEKIVDNSDTVIEKIVEKIGNEDTIKEKILETIVTKLSEKECECDEVVQNVSKPQTITPSGTTIVAGRNLNITIENVALVSGSASTDAPKLSNNQNLDFDVTLNRPGDYYSFTFDVRNKGNMDAQISDYTSTVLTEEQAKVLSFTLTYADGSAIKKGDTLKVGETKKIKFTALYKNSSEIRTEDVSAGFSGKITYVQAD